MNWRAVATVLVGHAVVLAAVLWMRPTVDPVPPPRTIHASLVVQERPEPLPSVAAPETIAPERDVASPPAPPSTHREPDPTPVLQVPESQPAPASITSAPAPVETVAEATAPSEEVPVTGPTAAPDRATPASLPGNPDEVRRYIAAVMRQLHRYKTYPRELKKAKTEGTVVIQFTIDRAGRLLASDVKQSSGHPELDRAAMDMLARANPLPGIPDSMNRDELALAIPVEYSLITDR